MRGPEKRAFEMRLCDDPQLQQLLIAQVSSESPTAPDPAYREAVMRRLGLWRETPLRPRTTCRRLATGRALAGAVAAAVLLTVAIIYIPWPGRSSSTHVAAIPENAPPDHVPGNEPDNATAKLFSELTTNDRLQRLEERWVPEHPRLESPALSFPLPHAQPHVRPPHVKRKPM
jgi:hypothetical protein